MCHFKSPFYVFTGRIHRCVKKHRVDSRENKQHRSLAQTEWSGQNIDLLTAVWVYVQIMGEWPFAEEMWR